MEPSIPIIAKPSAGEFVTLYAKRAQPVVIQQAIDDWRCRTHWSDAYLSARLDERKFLVNRSARGKFSIFSSRMQDADKDGALIVKFSELLDLLNNNEYSNFIHYMQQKTIDENFPELLEDIEYVDFIDRKLIRNVNFWFGQKGSHIPLHFDTFDNLLVQVRGAKWVTLFAADQTPFLYPGRDGAEFASAVDVDEPDFDQYPLFREARIAYRFLLNEGEILYLPAFWWHYIVTESAAAMSLNYWYHWVNGEARAPFIAARELWRLSAHYIATLPSAQKTAALCECRRLLEHATTTTSISP